MKIYLSFIFLLLSTLSVAFADDRMPLADGSYALKRASGFGRICTLQEADSESPTGFANIYPALWLFQSGDFSQAPTRAAFKLRADAASALTRALGAPIVGLEVPVTAAVPTDCLGCFAVLAKGKSTDLQDRYRIEINVEGVTVFRNRAVAVPSIDWQLMAVGTCAANVPPPTPPTTPGGQSTH